MSIIGKRTEYFPPISPQIVTKRTKHNNASLRRMIAASCFELDDSLIKNGYNPDKLREEFQELYKTGKNTLFGDKYYYDIDDEDYKQKNRLENDLKKYFGEVIPQGFHTKTIYEDRPYELGDIGYGNIWYHFIFPFEKDNKITFIKAIIEIDTAYEFGPTDETYNNVSFEQINSREAIDSIPGFGNHIQDYNYRLIIQSLIET